MNKIKKLYKKIAVINVLVFIYSAVSLLVSILTGGDTWVSIGYSAFCLVSFIGVIKSSINQAQKNLDELNAEMREKNILPNNDSIK